jgi:nicotinate-nucleotide adenylyltransferase
VRLGILGGTFNPIHLGHLRVAEEVSENLDLESVYLIPSSIPPHKITHQIADFSHRLEMVRLASEISPVLKVWDIEGQRPGPSYSIKTLRLFHSHFGPGLELFFIIGTDAFLWIKTWKEYKDLFRYASFVVINRQELKKDELFLFIESLDAGLVWNNKKKCFCHPMGTDLFSMNTTIMDISASRIRQMVARDESIRFIVPEIVRKYIKNKGLYLINEPTR